ncbi:hypothetical protein LOD99_10661 [Oopsacas minuta]|uniref:Tetraspanin n=1 Tax=Oopsacas minuta TaxID=111878 RepID=A0AAV7KEX9_9METZ|nr:hypothetical protein LOD99_10661 [Oopsacas minuta]
MNVSEIIFRLSFVLLNLLVIVGGVCLIIVGAVLISFSSALLEDFNMLVSGSGFDYTVFLNSAIILIVVGLILVVIGLVGIIGTIKHKIFAFLLIGYMVVLGIIIVLQVVGVILAFVYQAQVIETIREDLGPQLIEQYGNNDTGVISALNFIQMRLECCGINDTYNDFTNQNISIPESCTCEGSAPCINVIGVDALLNPYNVTSAYALGCLTTAENLLENRTYQYVLGGLGLVFLVFEIAVILFALCIIFMDFKGDD